MIWTKVIRKSLLRNRIFESLFNFGAYNSSNYIFSLSFCDLFVKQVSVYRRACPPTYQIAEREGEHIRPVSFLSHIHQSSVVSTEATISSMYMLEGSIFTATCVYIFGTQIFNVVRNKNISSYITKRWKFTFGMISQC